MSCCPGPSPSRICCPSPSPARRPGELPRRASCALQEKLVHRLPLGTLQTSRQLYRGVVQYKGKQESALTWEHYKVAQDLQDSGGRCFAHKAERVMMELWDFYRCEPGMEDMAARVQNKVCQKLVPDMFYKARIQAVISYHTQVLKTTVPPSWLATHYDTWDFMARRSCEPQWWDETHKAARERRLKMPEPAHHQGSQCLQIRS